MPIYLYKCKHCRHITEEVRSVKKRKGGKCKCCGGEQQQLVTKPAVLITDTSFGYTGKVDKRLGDRPIEGRKDWKQRVEEKGYMELERSDVKRMAET